MLPPREFRDVPSLAPGISAHFRSAVARPGSFSCTSLLGLGITKFTYQRNPGRLREIQTAGREAKSPLQFDDQCSHRLTSAKTSDPAESASALATPKCR